MDRKTRRLLTMYRAYYLKADIDRFYMRTLGKGDCVSIEIHSLKNFLTQTGGKLLEDVKNNRLFGNMNTTSK